MVNNCLIFIIKFLIEIFKLKIKIKINNKKINKMFIFH